MVSPVDLPIFLFPSNRERFLTLLKRTKLEIVDRLIEEGYSKKENARAIVECVFEAIKDGLLRGDDFQIDGFGIFRPVKREAHIGINPATQEKIHIPDKYSARFTVSKSFKNRMNEVLSR